jgi:nucleotide-binding universal stress UspA family protein
MHHDRSDFSDRTERMLQRRAENGWRPAGGPRRPRRTTVPRRPCRIVVGVSGSPASLAALRRAVAEARRCGRPLVALSAWEPPEGEALYCRWPDPQWARHWYAAARTRLADAFEHACGGVPADIDVTLRVERARPGPALLDLAAHPDDLLVLGTRPGLRRGPVRRHVRRHARCPVLTVPLAQPDRADLRALRRLVPTDFGT